LSDPGFHPRALIRVIRVPFSFLQRPDEFAPADDRAERTQRTDQQPDQATPQPEHAPLEAAFEAAGGDPEREFELGVAYAAQQCAELLIAGAPGIHFYALNKAPATRAVLGALRASKPWERVRGDAASLTGSAD